MPTSWHNRITRYGEEAPDQLLAHPLNFRTHPKHQQDALAGVLGEVGIVQNVIVNERTGHVVDGHLRIALAMRQNQPTVPVTYVDLDPAEESLILATLDPISALATADADKLRELLDQVSTSDAAVMQMLSDLAEQEGVVDFGGGTELLTDPDEIPDVPDDPITKPGDLWLLGRHRLLCGDSTNADDVARLMAGERADMVWTDPPYGVAIGDKNKWLNSVGPSNRIEDNLQNDTLGEDALLAMLRGAFANAVEHCTAGASWYVAAPAGPLHLLWGQALNDLGILRQMLIWVKDNSTFSPLGVTYHWQHEPIFYGWLPNGSHAQYGDRKQTTVWEIDRPTKSADHPTMKPVELVARAIQHASLPGQIVLDMFGGSGTTMIAAEQEGRSSCLMELDPHYCDVIVRRWENATGETATRQTEAMAAD